MNTEIEFSQHSLQDYVDCAFRFKLRYLDHLAWPAARTDDQLKYETRQRQGVDFHRLVQQWLSGIPRDVLETNLRDPEVILWWQAFLNASQNFSVSLEPQPGIIRLPEYTLSARLAGQRLMAKFDLLVVEPGQRLTIFDWKTGHQPQPQHRFLERIQTRVYLYLAVAAGGIWHAGTPFPPEQVEMIYWQAAAPLDMVRLPYSHSQMSADQEYLSRLITEIIGMESDQFLQTENTRLCEYCVYRSYCQRGTTPGSQSAWESGSGDEIDLSDIQPIEY